MMNERKVLMNREVAKKKIRRMALEIAEQLSGEEIDLVLAGISKNGPDIANQLLPVLRDYLPSTVHSISLSFDKTNPGEISFSEKIDFSGKNIIIIDDVSNTGKALVHAMKPFLSFKTNRIQMLVLVERTHKLFPVKPDYVGLSVATTAEDYIKVKIENHEVMGAYIE